jgi:gluconate 5-dehydrogenase
MKNNTFSLAGKTALVTGGSRGIGLAIAKALAQNKADVAILARNENQLKRAKEQIRKCGGKRVRTFCFNLEEIGRIEDAFGDVVRETSGIDILVNCAGTTARAKAEEIKFKDWERVIKINLTAVLAISQAFCRHRQSQRRGGKIINIGSLMCYGARPGTATYASSKGGLLMLTKSLAVEWAKYNINVNAIGPGYIATELTAPLQSDENFNRWVISRTPLGRWGEPTDVAGAAVFLASAASDFITGQIIYVDGGWTAAL